MTATRRIPIDFKAVAAESGLTAGCICRSPAFGWGVQNTEGIDGPDFGCITPPPMNDGETLLKIESGHWVFYSTPINQPTT